MATDWFDTITSRDLSSFTPAEERFILEIKRLRAERTSAINETTRLHHRLGSVYNSLAKEMHALHSDDLCTLLGAIIHQRRGALTELAEIHDVLAEALGYQKAPTLEEDPNCPCPGDYVTGDHTAATLAAEAARKLTRQQDYARALGRAMDRANNNVAELTQKLASSNNKIQKLAHSNDNATSQIVELQQELAARKRQCSCSYWVDQDKIMPSPDCPAHEVDASDEQTKKITKKEMLRREIAALRFKCGCPYNTEMDCLDNNPTCPTHGDEALEKKLAGEKALNTLAYVRKYFMGSDHGHEV